MTVSLSILKARALLLDIEGTTTPVEFVYRTLFPYARAHAAAYLRREGSSAAARAAVAQLQEESGLAQDARAEAILDYVRSLMDRDSKSPGLKALQGLIWQDGYKNGELRGQVYADVRPAFERWRARGMNIYIYSSGSVLAQRLLFGSTHDGDLTRDVTGFFDTAVGPKTAPESYALIARRIGAAPAQVLFISDVVGELDAAQAAGMPTALCVRCPDIVPGGSHPTIRTFDDIFD